MQRLIRTALIGIAIASPAAAQTPNVQQLLQGLMTGNQSQDQALRDAFERGYQRGRQDEARLQRDHGDRAYRRRGDERESDRYRDERGPEPRYGRRGGYDER